MATDVSAIEGDLIFYSTSDGSVRLEVVYQDETFWLSQKRMAELFGVDVRTVSEHFQNIFRTGELDQRPAIRKFRTTTADGKAYETQFYHLDAIIAVGYRVNSRQATQFRIWATQTLREYIIKGFVLDDERLKQGSRSARTTSTNCWSGSARFGPASGASIRRSPTSTNSAASTIRRTPRSRTRSLRSCKTSCTGPSPARPQPN